MKLPSNSTHVLQPLDVGVYGPVKTAWETILIKFARQNLWTALNKELFPSLLAQLWKSDCFSEKNVRAGFRKCGIMPFDPSQIPADSYNSAEIFDRPLSTPSLQQAVQSQLTRALDLAGCSVSSPRQSASYALDLAGGPLTQTPDSSRPTTPTTIKDFFLSRLTPMLNKNKNTTANRQKAVQRLHGESLTSEECVKRLEQEAAEKERKKRARPGRGKGKQPAKRAATDPNPPPAVGDMPAGPSTPAALSSESSEFSDSDSDPEWIPASSKSSASQRNVFDVMDRF